MPIPNDENNINAHTRAGIFLKNVANPLTTLANLGKGEICSLPKSDTIKANIPATVVDDIAIATVVITLKKTFGSFSALGIFGGKKS